MPLRFKIPFFYDPRAYQITILAALFIYGVVWLEFEITLSRAIALIGTALKTQFLCTVFLNLPKFDPKSSMISGLSLCLLLRTNDPTTAVFVAMLTICSKFVIRWSGKHLFNPTNFGLAAGILLTGNAWVSPGQWGNAAFFGFLMACLGGLVVNKASRSDVTFSFLGFYLTILFARALWLGQPMDIPLHMLQNGAFLLFTFFMISDPKTTPDSKAGRILFAFLVAFGVGLIHFGLYRPNGLIWSLAVCSLFTPFIDFLLKGEKYEWKNADVSRKQPILSMEQRRIL